MKLHELGAQRPTEQVAKTLQAFMGDRVSFDRLSEDQTRRMLGRVQGLLKEYKTSVSRHYSERNPDYLKLVMMQQALTARLDEKYMGFEKTKAAVAKNPKVKDPGAVAASIGRKKYGKKAFQKAAAAGKKLGENFSGQSFGDDDYKKIARKKRHLMALNPRLEPEDAEELAAEKLGYDYEDVLAWVNRDHINENRRRRLREASDVQQAQVVMAAQDMVDQIQKMMEQISSMQFKDLPALVDAIKNEVGVDQANRFQADATAALSSLLAAVQGGKTQMEAAQGVLTGQAPTVPGTDMGAAPTMPAGELGAEGGEDDMDLGLDTNLPPEEEEGDEAPAASLGRERR